MKKLLLSPWLSLITLFLVIGLRVVDPTFVESVRLRYFDTLLTQNIQQSDIQVVNIDDETLKEKGQFPFPRNEYANLIKDLYNRGAGLVVFNIFMPEGDRFGKDDALTKILQEYPVVLPQTGTDEPFEETYKPFRPGVSIIGTGDVGVKYENILPNIQVFNDNAAGIGVVNTLPEIDGVTRRIPMVVSSKGLLYPSLSLETLRVASGDPSFQVKVNEGSIEAVRIPQFGKIQTDNLGRIWVKSSRFREFSSINLPDDFKGSIVIVGLTAKGLNNPVATSNGAVFPHYVQASVLETLIKGINISRPDWATGVELLAVLVLSIISILLARWKYGFVIIGSILVAIPFGLEYVYNTLFYLFDSTIVVFAIVVVYIHSFTVKFLTELNQKLQIKKQFGSYVSPVMVERLQKNPELIKLGGERKELSIVMTDLRGFTTLGESYGDDVEGLTSIMNDYMTAISEPVLKNDGCLIKFIGDASLHVHGAPLDDASHAKNAVKTALEMIEAVTGFNESLISKGKPIIGMGAGVNTGQTLIGNIGSKSRFGYDVLGDSVSTAARLEGQTKSYGVLLIIGPETAKLVKDDYFVIKLDNIAVKGKTVGLDIYTVLQPDRYNKLEFANARTVHNKMFKHYCKQEWAYANTMCMDLIGSFNGELDYYYEMMRKRIAGYMADESFPKEWKGTFVATSK
jgi:adenylate cyclase